MKNFPTICIDNFLDNPDEIRDFALSLEYAPSTDGSYVGLRSQALHHVNLNMLTTICKRVLSCFYDLRSTPVTWEVTSYFYKIYPTDSDSNIGKIQNPTGNMLDGIIYLNPNANKPSGISLCQADHAETASFGNVYNRLVAFDGENFVRDNGFDCGEEFKLIQVFHIKQLVSMYLPLPRLREQVGKGFV